MYSGAEKKGVKNLFAGFKINDCKYKPYHGINAKLLLVS